MINSFGLISVVNINETLKIQRFAKSEYGSLLVVLPMNKKSGLVRLIIYWGSKSLVIPIVLKEEVTKWKNKDQKKKMIYTQPSN